jgi:predicted exporter
MCRTSRHAHALAAVGDDPGRFRRSVDDDVAVLDPLDLESEAGEEEMIARRQR